MSVRRVWVQGPAPSLFSAAAENQDGNGSHFPNLAMQPRPPKAAFVSEGPGARDGTARHQADPSTRAQGCERERIQEKGDVTRAFRLDPRAWRTAPSVGSSRQPRYDAFCSRNIKAWPSDAPKALYGVSTSHLPSNLFRSTSADTSLGAASCSKGS